MSKRTIRLTELDLHNIIKESVKKVLKENKSFSNKRKRKLNEITEPSLNRMIKTWKKYENETDIDKDPYYRTDWHNKILDELDSNPNLFKKYFDYIDTTYNFFDLSDYADYDDAGHEISESLNLPLNVGAMILSKYCEINQIPTPFNDFTSNEDEEY